MTRDFVRVVARVVAGVVLLAQWSISAYACPGLSPAAQASQQPQVAGTPQAADPDVTAASIGMVLVPPCGDMTCAMDPDSANLCAEHCKYGQQSDHASTVNVPAAALVALYPVPMALEVVLAPRPAAAAMSALVAASPPHAILHCVFRL